MRTRFLAALAAIALLCPLAAFAAVDTYVQMNPTPADLASSGSSTITLAGSNTTCGAGAVVFPFGTGGMAQINARGTFTSGSLKFKATPDGTNFSGDLKVYPRTGGAAVTSIGAAGSWLVQMRADSGLCVYSASFSGAATISVRTLPLMSHVDVLPFKSNTAGSGIACNSGTSPCTVTNSAADVLSSNDARKACSLTATDMVDLYCKRATAALSAASSSNFDFILNAGSATKKTGGSWLCHDAGVVWTGPVNCIASAGSAIVDLAVTETE